MMKSKNYRRRSSYDEDDNDDPIPDSLQIKPSTSLKPNSSNTQKPKTQLPSSSSSSRPKLSFVEDDDEEEAIRIPSSSKSSHKSRGRTTHISFQPQQGDDSTSRRSSSKKAGVFSPAATSSHKLTSANERLVTPSSTLTSNVQPQAGEYTKEKLLELQKNTRTIGGSKPAETKQGEPVIVLKGLVKPTSPKATDSPNLKPLETEVNRKEGEKKLLGIANHPDDSLIPDQAMIAAIRAKRERLRQARVATPDYIPLDGIGGRDLGKDAAGSSDDEIEFSRGRIAMLGERSDAEVVKGVFEELRGNEGNEGVSGGGGGNEEEDEEEKKWEEEQFRKGFGKRVDDGTKNRGGSVDVQTVVPVPSSVLQGNSQSSSGYHHTIGSNGGIGVMRNGIVMTTKQKAEAAFTAIEQSFQMLQESSGRTKSSVLRTDENLASSLLNKDQLEKSLSDAGEKYLFMQKLRDFISVLCDFLQAKAPFIEELEEQMQKLHEDRASAIMERRAADDADEMAEVEAAVKAAMSVFNKGGGAGVATAAAAAAQAAAFTAREHSNLPVELDEFGRDINIQKRLDSERRAQARKRRTEKSEDKRVSNARDNQLVEGELSSDESDSEGSIYESSSTELLRTAEQIFSDAADEYKQLSYVKETLEEWKKRFSSCYKDAYMSLSIPAIFSPYVRLELLKWDPLYDSSDFDQMHWHSLLFSYGMPEDSSDFDPSDADADLVPGLVEKVALPILHHEIEHCWDMLSSRKTKNAVLATQLVITYIPASSEALQELLLAVKSRLAEAITNLTVPTWSPFITSAVPQAARLAAYRFGLSVRLLRNICMWKDILAMSVVEQLALDELLSGKVLPHVRNITSNIHDAITRTERIVASLSGVWPGPSTRAETSRKLQPLVEYLGTLGKLLEKKRAAGVSSDDIVGLARRLKKMLVDLSEYDKARAILKTFQLKEAL